MKVLEGAKTMKLISLNFGLKVIRSIFGLMIFNLTNNVSVILHVKRFGANLT